MVRVSIHGAQLQVRLPILRTLYPLSTLIEELEGITRLLLLLLLLLGLLLLPLLLLLLLIAIVS